jgi:hypothetical protein
LAIMILIPRFTTKVKTTRTLVRHAGIEITPLLDVQPSVSILVK